VVTRLNCVAIPWGWYKSLYRLAAPALSRTEVVSIWPVYILKLGYDWTIHGRDHSVLAWTRRRVGTLDILSRTSKQGATGCVLVGDAFAGSESPRPLDRPGLASLLVSLRCLRRPGRIETAGPFRSHPAWSGARRCWGLRCHRTVAIPESHSRIAQYRALTYRRSRRATRQLSRCPARDRGWMQQLIVVWFTPPVTKQPVGTSASLRLHCSVSHSHGDSAAIHHGRRVAVREDGADPIQPAGGRQRGLAFGHVRYRHSHPVCQ
jgi:hypothetical protein